MTKILHRLMAWFGQLHRAEFEYRDRAGTHRGRCYVRYPFAGRRRMRRQPNVLDMVRQPALGNWTGEQISTR